MSFSLVVAASENNVIGVNNTIPWRLSGDLKLFKKITTGHVIVMGRKTFESLGRVLPDRESWVLGSQLKEIEGVKNFSKLENIVEMAKNRDEVFIIGGAQIYHLFLPLVEKIHLTRVHTTIEGDTFLPAIDWKKFKRVSVEKFLKDEKNEFDWSYEVWERN